MLTPCACPGRWRRRGWSRSNRDVPAGTPRPTRSMAENGRCGGFVLPERCAPGRTRTCAPRLRRPVLYPTELRAPMEGSVSVPSLSSLQTRTRPIDRDDDPSLPGTRFRVRTPGGAQSGNVALSTKRGRESDPFSAGAGRRRRDRYPAERTSRRCSDCEAGVVVNALQRRSI